MIFHIAIQLSMERGRKVEERFSYCLRHQHQMDTIVEWLNERTAAGHQ